jgi:hypothetical protein
MNPRLVEPGFIVVCLHVDGSARPGKDEYGDDDAQGAQRHVKRKNTDISAGGASVRSGRIGNRPRVTS